MECGWCSGIPRSLTKAVCQGCCVVLSPCKSHKFSYSICLLWMDIVLGYVFYKFSCNFLDLAVRQSPQGLSCDIFDKHSQQSMQVLKWLECLMFIPISQLLWSWGLSIVNFTGSWGFVVVISFLSFTVSLIVLLKVKGYPLKILLKRTRGLLDKEQFPIGISAFGVFRMILFRVL